MSVTRITLGDSGGFDWIKVNVPGQPQKIMSSSSQWRLVAPGKQMAGASVAAVEIHRITGLELLHERCEIPARSAYHQMVVVGH